MRKDEPWCVWLYVYFQMKYRNQVGNRFILTALQKRNEDSTEPFSFSVSSTLQQSSAISSSTETNAENIMSENRRLRMEIAMESIAIAKLKRVILTKTGNLYIVKVNGAYQLQEIPKSREGTPVDLGTTVRNRCYLSRNVQKITPANRKGQYGDLCFKNVQQSVKGIVNFKGLIGQSRWYSSTGSSSGGKAQDKSGQKSEQITTKPVAEAGIKANKKEHQSRINSTGKGFEDTTYMAKEYYRNGLFSFYDIEFDMQKSRLKQPSSLKKTT
ncbi:hypothetical protein CHS0354_040717 [Potamilus streckersoni]|uniref:NADH dehydrogenase [ubiquinone] flavoprotein 3, mitochondrial n=1 Tax=Potamilus streckersoni TaxID=2493646 RepID=A0AAE0SKZ4_9BIVA|nr:hypothetical protein CHS0354_040717 [Potamilus streckersoni]